MRALPSDMSDNQAASESGKSSKVLTFRKRFLSTLWLWGLVVVGFGFDNSWAYLAMFLSFSVIGIFEFFHLVPDGGFRRFRGETIGVTVAYVALIFGYLWGIPQVLADHADGIMIAVLVGLICMDRVRFPSEGYRMVDEIGMTIFAFSYIVILFGFVPKILHLPFDEGSITSGRFYVVYLLIVTKFTDMGAYLVGSLIGKDKMVPEISPGKTWQGFGGAIGFGLLGSFGSYFLFGDRISLITPLHAGILGVLLALVAILGDLVESIVKRGLKVKDSGHVMPGIGGVLDLIDSILLTAPVLFVYLLILLG